MKKAISSCSAKGKRARPARRSPPSSRIDLDPPEHAEVVTMSRRALARAQRLVCTGSVWLSFALGLCFTAQAWAQAAGNRFSERQPELANLFNAAYIAQARVFSEVAAIDAADDTQSARDEFERRLQMRARMSMAEMMAMTRMEASMTMLGPYAEQEAALGSELMQLLREPQTPARIRRAYDASPLPSRVVQVIRAGRSFEAEVYEILADNTIGDKASALGAAAAAYLAQESSVPAEPKPASLLLEHPQAGAFTQAYPALSRTLWSTQWLQLATIEAMLLALQDSQYWGSVDTVSRRFDNMLSAGNASRSSMPTELPMAPAIAPTLFSASPEVAIILDNLHMFETVVADVVTWPNLDNEGAVLDGLVDIFTSHDQEFDTTLDYLVSALRGGIYNQGGPAVGELKESERNRSRSEMGMQHAMVMSSP
jgi:uncharacterized protein YqcC (DUF446 family)